MRKPEKPKEQLPKTFGGIKENFSDDKQATGYQPDVPDILGGANLNYILDTAGKKDEYHDGISDFINATPIDNTITVNSNNELVYEDLTEVVKCENVPENPPVTVKKILKTRTGEYIDPYSNKNKGQGYQLFDLKYSDHILEGDKAMGWALCGDYTLSTDVEFYQTCVNEKNAGTEGTTTLGDVSFTSWTNSNGHVFYDISEKDKVDQIYNATGSAWFYGIDTATQRIFLPRNDNFVQNTGDVEKVGRFTDGGAPDINGYFDTYVDGSGASVGTRNISGAFYPKGSGKILSNNDEGADGLCGVNFSASRSSKIYGNSDTIQPRSVKQLCYMCVGNTIYNEEKIDIEKLEGDVRSLTNRFSNLHLDRNIGEIVASTLPLVDAGLHLLDGALIVGSGIYGQFVDYIAKLYNEKVYTLYAWLYNDGEADHIVYTKDTTPTVLYNVNGTKYTGTDFTNDSGVIKYGTNECVYTADKNVVIDNASYFCTQEEWDSSIEQYGVCGKFVYSETDNTVRLPKLTGIIEGTTDISKLGGIVSAGLPNITGTMVVPQNNYTYSGVLWGAPTGPANVEPEGNAAFQNRRITLDASRASAIYGNSTTVQPQTAKVLYYIVIATSTKTDVQVEMDKYATDLNGKADKDLTNTSPSISFAAAMNEAGIRTVTETYQNGSSWYRVYSDGWCEQGGASSTSGEKVITLLIPYLSSDYTVLHCESYTGNNSLNYRAIYNKTATQFQMYCNYAVDNRWQASGYIR